MWFNSVSETGHGLPFHMTPLLCKLLENVGPCISTLSSEGNYFAVEAMAKVSAYLALISYTELRVRVSEHSREVSAQASPAFTAQDIRGRGIAQRLQSFHANLQLNRSGWLLHLWIRKTVLSFYNWNYGKWVYQRSFHLSWSTGVKLLSDDLQLFMLDKCIALRVEIKEIS